MIQTCLSEFTMPPCAALLGAEILDADVTRGWVRIRFAGRETFCNPSGHIQGGLLTAMLDDTMGPAVLVATAGACMPVTIALSVAFLAPARPGPLTGEATVLKLGRSIGHVEAKLTDPDGQAVARASASVRLVPVSARAPAQRP
ncbi:PaaI family thioesterase [Phreatobacter sp. AB_2022a]|uniref:PaaI family thioesterase n=1 Tax=Phreatobacter sp. AB_2022a TaxID=3003134 RepID=UPI002286DB62|nr:PaaI family thioesterase [Phreatobacter sp. AB_2022a]MCZ0736163.1 PaaI family thioesterase [Phreatobacter sp. AB_2022a]